MVAYNWRCISMLGDDVGRDEYIDQKHGRFREIEAAGAGFGALSTNTENLTI
jgi:hypothetical protein